MSSNSALAMLYDTPTAEPVGLIGPGEPPAVTVEAAPELNKMLFICDHASNRIPFILNDLGLTEAELNDHIGYDIGAAALTRELAKKWQATAVYSNYSRLVIDLNRHPEWHEQAVPLDSDTIIIPANQNLSESAFRQRVAELFEPYHLAVSEEIKLRLDNDFEPTTISVHSCTKALRGEPDRPWEIGVLWRQDGRIAQALIKTLREQNPELTIGDNEPYSAQMAPKGFNFTVTHHCEDAGLPHVLFEVRQDLISDTAGVQRYAEILDKALRAVIS